MFTGLVQELGEITDVADFADESRRLTIRTGLNPGVGDSISVNGVCLTAERVVDGHMSVLAMSETLRRTSIGPLKPGDRVNLESALTLQTPLGGHIVQGHVDAVGTVLSRTRSEHWDVVRISAPAQVGKYVVAKGSIAVDGVSLTVATCEDQPSGATWFEVYLIPVTLAATTLGELREGAHVNLEADILAKYVERLSQQ